MNLMNVYWPHSDESVKPFEFEYINSVILAKIAHQAISFRDAGPLERGSFFVFGAYGSHIEPSDFEHVKKIEKPNLIHLLNEVLNHDVSYYRYANSVLRFYYDPSITAANALTIPLGYQTGFGNLSTRADGSFRDRKYVWAFLGRVHPNRAAMISIFRDVSPNFQHITTGWLTSETLGIEDVCKIYADTKFIPCPFGHINPDSYRVMEALENGCIPVVRKFYGIDWCKFTYGNHPFVTGSNWKDCRNQIRKLLRDPDALDRYHQRVRDWYARFKLDLARDVATLVATGSRDGLASELAELQAWGSKNWYVRAAYHFHFTVMPPVRRYRERLRMILGRLIRSRSVA